MSARDVLSRIACIVASGAGVGYVPRIPGTAGSLLGIAVGVFVLQSPRGLLGVILAVFAAALWSGGRAEKVLGKKDAPQIIIDEVLGMLICLVGMPFTPSILIFCFVVFRIMDIIKPFPACRMQHLPGSWGIVLDDIVAAGYTQLVVRTVLFGFSLVAG